MNRHTMGSYQRKRHRRTRAGKGGRFYCRGPIAKRDAALRQSPALSERGNSPAIALAALLPSGPTDRGVSSAPAPLPLLMAAI